MCIAGGMLGAILGEMYLPENKQILLAWTPKSGGIKRDKFLWPSANFESLFESLFDLCPNELEIIQ